MTLINRTSFKPLSTDADGSQNGTVEVTLRGQTKTVEARHRPQYGWIFAYGIIGRYQTGGKVWPGSIRSNTDGTENVRFGRYDNHPKFRKENAIWFAE